jgi:hypothetical protein
MKKVMTIFGAMYIAAVFLASCSNKAQVSLEKVLQITGNTFNGACTVGNAFGSASINFNGEKVSVNYSAMGYTAIESGFLENLVMEDNGENNTYRITGNWNNQDAGDGHFRLGVFGAEEPNTIYVAIEGSNWSYYDSKKLSDEDFNKIITILGKTVSGPTVAAKSSAPYDYMSKISGTYKIISNKPDYIPERVAIKFSEKNIIIDKEKYDFDVVYNKNDTLIKFGSVSEDSGDFLGGGTILINGSKVQFKMLFGPEANEEYIFEK